MTIELKTLDLTPRRQTFSHIARRIGEGRTASRYEEATYDLQASAHFHYRPLWAPEYEIHDTARTAIKMKDWYVFKDPRQYYYGTYNMNRADLQKGLESGFTRVDDRDLLSKVSPEWLAKVHDYLIPARHYEWGANMNNFSVADYGYGTQITSAAAFSAADRLGMAQIIGRIGLLMDENSGASLEEGKNVWLNADYWQGVRNMLEDSFVLEDWFEMFVAQNLAMDGILHPLMFQIFDEAGQDQNGLAISMVTEFMPQWFKDNNRWVDAVIKVAAAESDENRKQLSDWYSTWSQRAETAAKPLCDHVLGDGGAAVEGLIQSLNDRAAKIGLNI
ncbi:MAG: aromatic/alkene monooxygenase hydroxylase subunit beta [Sneathiella sp.]